VHVLVLALSLMLPQHGVLVPGKSLGGVRLGMTPAQVQSTWGMRYGRCRGCAQETWYYNYRRFNPEGAAVRFRRGRVDAVWTLWLPRGWHTPGGLQLGQNALEVNVRYGALVSIPCGSYRALIRTTGRVLTAFYIYGQRLWGFGLTRPESTPCF
jgi:hypothetical protein